jgi:4-oxalocrotonate tautomerase
MAAHTPATGNPEPEEIAMPIVTIQITREGTTAAQKAALIKGATDLLADVLGKLPGLTFVLIQEVDVEDWGVDGLPAAEHRRRAGGTLRGPVGQ